MDEQNNGEKKAIITVDQIGDVISISIAPGTSRSQLLIVQGELNHRIGSILMNMDFVAAQAKQQKIVTPGQGPRWPFRK